MQKNAPERFSYCVYVRFYYCVTSLLLSSEMADECLFDFLHMEIVSHVYKEQQSNKGEMDNKVCSNEA